jgi:DNA helicase II / ATP-dependent DNA helicase PcrA
MFRIFGPPGTGKTTTLLNMLDKALDSGVAPNSIAFLAFTRKAASEAKERASARFHLDPDKDLFYFRTLHSLALSASGIRTEQVMGKEHYKELSDIISIPLISDTSLNDDIVDKQASDHPILSLINLARLCKNPLRKQYNQTHMIYDWNTVNYISKCYKEYKARHELYDFTDMLQCFIEGADVACPKFDLVFLDEAQDLSPLQWDIAHMLDKNSKKMYAAGDDDQAIYRWAGADVEHFITLDGSSETLSQSYRVPRRVHTLAERIVSRIKNRYPKRYEPREALGNVQHISRLEDLDLSEGKWLILAQAVYILSPVKQVLRSSGYLYSFQGYRSISTKISSAVNGWEQLRKGRALTAETVKDIYSFMSTGTQVKRGFKKLSGADDNILFTMELLQKDWGLMIGKDLIWRYALDRLPDESRAYITAMLRRGEKFNAEPRITVSTIHGSKGGESENVVIFTDVSPAADNEMSGGNDDLHRVFYVAVTRTKENLYIVEAEDNNRSYYI